jgi:hypothetical protein
VDVRSDQSGKPVDRPARERDPVRYNWEYANSRIARRASKPAHNAV